MNCNSDLCNTTTISIHNTTIAVTTVSTAISNVLFVNILTYIDYVNRCVSFLFFLIYFIILIAFKEMRTLNLLYVHHANIVGFFFVLMYMIYFNVTAPTTTDPTLFQIECTITEVIWGVLKYLRAFSVLLIALYRFSAVFCIEFFKFVNKSYVHISVPIILVWILAIVLFASTKFALNTTYGSLFCIDGFSLSTYDTVAYLIISAVFDLVVPYSAVTIIYILIKYKLNKITIKTRVDSKNGRVLSIVEPTLSQLVNSVVILDNMSNQVNVEKRKKKKEMKKNKRFSSQLIAMNICYIGCFTMSFILSFRYVIDDFNNKFYYFRQVLRIFNVLFQALVPIVSLYFNPNI